MLEVSPGNTARNRTPKKQLINADLPSKVPPLWKRGLGGFDFYNQRQIPLNPPLLKGDLIVSGRLTLLRKKHDNKEHTNQTECAAGAANHP